MAPKYWYMVIPLSVCCPILREMLVFGVTVTQRLLAQFSMSQLLLVVRRHTVVRVCKCRVFMMVTGWGLWPKLF